MSHEPKLSELQEKWHGSLKEYVIGFILSILLTLFTYFAVVKNLFSDWTLAVAIAVLAVVQAAIQLLCFLHIHREDKPRWNLVVFCFMVTTLLILVLGTIWIMYNLNERVMPEM